jgi:antitoxin (DNA-binding transcriptional repressor) of toxin-antitoxin stability system
VRRLGSGRIGGACINFNMKLKFWTMKTVTMLKLRQGAQGILRRIAKGERFVLTHRGRPAARLEPLEAATLPTRATDPFLTIARRAKPSPRGPTRHQDIDRIVYGGR